MSAMLGSRLSPCATERRRARNTSFGSRARCTSSLNVSEPNSSAAFRLDVAAALRSDAPCSLMLRIASPDDAEPIGVVVLSKVLIMIGTARPPQAEKRRNRRYILNDVKQIQIRPQDYYAPIVGEFEHLVLLALVRLG